MQVILILEQNGDNLHEYYFEQRTIPSLLKGVILRNHNSSAQKVIAYGHFFCEGNKSPFTNLRTDIMGVNKIRKH